MFCCLLNKNKQTKQRKETNKQTCSGEHRRDLGWIEADRRKWIPDEREARSPLSSLRSCREAPPRANIRPAFIKRGAPTWSITEFGSGGRSRKAYYSSPLRSSCCLGWSPPLSHPFHHLYSLRLFISLLPLVSLYQQRCPGGGSPSVGSINSLLLQEIITCRAPLKLNTVGLQTRYKTLSHFQRMSRVYCTRIDWFLSVSSLLVPEILTVRENPRKRFP